MKHPESPIDRMVAARERLRQEQDRLYSLRKNARWFMQHSHMVDYDLAWGRRHQEQHVLDALAHLFYAQNQAALYLAGLIAPGVN